MAYFILAMLFLHLNTQTIMDESNLILVCYTLLLEKFSYYATQYIHDLSKLIERNLCARTVFFIYVYTFSSLLFSNVLYYLSYFTCPPSIFFNFLHPPLSLPFVCLSSNSSPTPLLSISGFVLPNRNPNFIGNLVCSVSTLS